MIRWSCPNGCPAVLGPSRAARDAVCRFCLLCSEGSVHLVHREPTARIKAQAKKDAAHKVAQEAARLHREDEKAREKEEKEKKEAATAEWKREIKQYWAVDYHVSSNGRPRGSYDDLKAALKQVQAIRRAGVDATLSRVVNGRLDTGCFHGRVFVGWETQDGQRIARWE